MALLTQASSEAPASLRELAVPRAVARVLAACAGASSSHAELAFRDPVAESVFAALGADKVAFDAAELRCAAYRTLVVDGLTRHFFERQPDGLGVGVWSMLGTRSHRFLRPWVDVDSPEIAELRRHLLPSREGWVQLASCLGGPMWLEVLGQAKRKLLLVLDESVLPLPGEAMMRVLDEVSRRVVAGSEIVIAFDARSPLRPASPFQRGSAVELVLHDGASPPGIARYPRLRFVDDRSYPDELRTMVAGVNGIARVYQGLGAPALAHLRLV